MTDSKHLSTQPFMLSNCLLPSHADAGGEVHVGVPVGEPAPWGYQMARGLNLLTARTVETIKKEGKHADGGGLYLLVRKRGGTLEKLWMFRYKRGARGAEKEYALSLGVARDISLARARDTAALCRTALEQNRDPRNVIAPEAVQMPTFGEVADELITDVEEGFKSQATRANWRRTLDDRYCGNLRKIPVNQVDTSHVLKALQPIWLQMPETARKMRGRIERVLDVAKAKGYRDGENPARWKGHMKLMLAAQTAAKGQHRALEWPDMPDFMTRLKALDSVSALALEWTILTAARTGEAIGAPRSEVDRSNKVWIVPPARMKESREHRVPLCDRCIEIFDELAVFGSKWLFPARDPRKHMSNMAMMECLRGLDVNATVHGFRSTFRTWIQEETSFPDWMGEAALAHLSGDVVERSYKRGDALKKRRVMMQAWERYCLQAEGNVVSIKQAKS
jgi:integrase